jgi:hypothetical protein
MPSRRAELTRLPARIAITPRFILSLIAGCLLVEAAFLILDFSATHTTWVVPEALHDFVDLAGETSLPRWFATAQSMLICVTAWLIYLVVRQRRQRAMPWLVLSCFFTLLTVALGARLHERLYFVADSYLAMQRRFDGDPAWLWTIVTAGFSSQLWAALLVLPFGAILVVDLWRTPDTPHSRLLLFLVVACHVSAFALHRDALAFSSLMSMVGSTVLWYLLLTHAAGLARELRVTCVDDPPVLPARVRPAPEHPDFHVEPPRTIRRLILVCLTVELLFVLLDYLVTMRGHGVFPSLRMMFNLAREDSLPSWFSATQTALVALTLWSVLFVVRSRTASAWLRRGWFVIAAFFTYMAVDDGARVHETIEETVELLAQRSEIPAAIDAAWNVLQRYPSYAWHLLFVPLFVGFGLFLALFSMRQVPRGRARVTLLLALALLGLAVGLDFVEGLDDEHPWNAHIRIVEAFDLQQASWRLFDKSPLFVVRHFSKVLEELIEMFATTLLGSVFLSHLLTVGADVRLRWTPGTIRGR